MAVESKKAKAFALFDEGNTASSDGIKALKLKGDTRYNYYSEWRRMKGVPASPSGLKGESKERIKPISDSAVSPLPQKEIEDESLGDGEEENEAEENEQQPADESKHDEAKGSNGKKPLINVIPTAGLVFTSVEISAKTYMLWQLAKAQNECTFGDFVDSCVEDSFNGRGLDIGLLKIGGKDHG